MGKHTVMIREIEIGVPQDKVWAALANVGEICHAHPGVVRSRMITEQVTGVGAARHCEFTMMNATSRETVVEWNEGESLKIVAEELKNLPGIDTMSVDFKLRSHGAGTVLTATMDYSMKNPLFDLMNALMMKRMNASMLNGIVAGHKKYVEDGKIVTADTPLELDKVVVLQ